MTADPYNLDRDVGALSRGNRRYLIEGNDSLSVEAERTKKYRLRKQLEHGILDLVLAYDNLPEEQRTKTSKDLGIKQREETSLFGHELETSDVYLRALAFLLLPLETEADAAAVLNEAFDYVAQKQRGTHRLSVDVDTEETTLDKDEVRQMVDNGECDLDDLIEWFRAGEISMEEFETLRETLRE